MCKKTRHKDMFYPDHWTAKRQRYAGEQCRLCKTCVEKLRAESERTKQCGQCKVHKYREEFRSTDWASLPRRRDDETHYRICIEYSLKG